ncbi:MAG: hypothetical protein BRD48_07090 [Bacteroidetes bacterium QS_9_68_14]|nr:MAG: hypothetical protein BRD48_07090 [Bacteroidetes bacterium QS_9_68_14]
MLGGSVAERAQAQYATTKDEEDEPHLEAGAGTLQFQVMQNFALGSFQGSALSAKRHFSPRSALRAGLADGGFSGNRTARSTRRLVGRGHG